MIGLLKEVRIKLILAFLLVSVLITIVGLVGGMSVRQINKMQRKCII